MVGGCRGGLVITRSNKYVWGWDGCLDLECMFKEGIVFFIYIFEVVGEWGKKINW